MKYLITLIFISILFASCSKQEACYCNVGDGEYDYLPPSTNAQSSGTVNASGDLEEECELQDAFLKENSSENSYCEMK